MLKVLILPDADTVGGAAAAALSEAVDHAREDGDPVVGWPVGRTPLPVVAALQRRRGRLADVHVALMDDYVERSGSGLRRVAEDAPCSCRGAALRELVEPLAGAGVSADRLHSPDPADPEAYDALLADLGGVEVFVVALGASDGHIALNPPGSERDSRTRVVDVATSTRQDNVATFGLRSLDDVPAQGVTVGLGTIMRARRLVVLAHGVVKRDVVSRLLETDRFDPRLPASVVHEHPSAVLYVDRAAAGLRDERRA